MRESHSMIRLLPTLIVFFTLPIAARAQEVEKPKVEKPVVTTPVVTPTPAKPATEKPKDTATPKDTGKSKDGSGKPGEDKPKDGGEKQKDGEGEKPKGGEKEEPVDPPVDQPLPPGASPDDIRAMRSAQQMISTERRLLKRIKSGEIKGVDTLLRFEDVSSWPYQDGLKSCPEAVRKLDGKKVAMIGFMLPIDQVEHIKEFLLVQSLWACCYGTPPDINGIVRVVMNGDKRTDYQFDPVLVTGTFRVKESREDGYCVDIYQLEAESVSIVK